MESVGGATRASWAVGGHGVAVAHTVLGYAAFLAALGGCLALHYRRVVKNHVAAWPDEFWPSVSATIGDWFPERNVFQIVIAITSGPRFLLVGLCALLAALQHRPLHARVLLLVGILRTFACGGWVYITSTDHALTHDVAMGAYIALTPLWMGACFVSLAPGPNSPHAAAHRTAQRVRTAAALAFYACTPFMVHLYLRHRRDRVPGAYSYYAMFEWGLIVFDVLFDLASAWDLRRFAIHITYEDTAPAPAPAPAARPATAAPARSLPMLAWVVSQTYLASTAWSCVTCLVSLIFYFSVSNMAAKGHELLVLAQTLGLLAAWAPPLRNALATRRHGEVTVGARTPRTMGVLWLATLATVASFVVPDALVRLVINAVCTALVAVLAALDWAAAWEAGRLDETYTLWMLGFVLLLVARSWNYANSPLWPHLDATNGGRHRAALVLGAVCVAPLLLGAGVRRAGPAVRRAPRAIPQRRARFAVATLALGAWLCTLQTLLSDAGTLIAWGWTGFPVTGPTAVQHGALVIAAVAAGVGAALHAPRLGTHPAVLAAYAGGAALLFYADDWLGFAGGLAVAFAVPVLGLPLLQAALSHDPIAALLAAWTASTLFLFLNVLTVAYAFLPGAWIMREHTGAMLLVQSALLAAGVVNARAPHVAERLAVAAATQRRSFRRAAYVVLGALLVAAGIVPAVRTVPPSAIAPYHPAERVFTAGIWTVHFGFDQHMRDNTRRMARLFRLLELDVVGLLETDLHRPAFGNRDLTQYLAEELGMYADLGPSPKKHTWGAVLLSKFPILNSTHHLLPSPHGELAPAIHAVLDVFGVPTHVVVSHNGQEEDALDRELQSTALAQILAASYPAPALFLGYLVTHPHAPRPAPYGILFGEGRMLDVDPSDHDRWCQYLGFRALERVAYARVSRYTVTDTELQTFKLHVPHTPVPADRDVRPRAVMYQGTPAVPWAYPEALVLPWSRLHETHRYGPDPFPQYFEHDE
ncbi:Protein cwh43 [Malassezia obtusa]|uniref:Protein cwh43 n=1 Tax=Malassezia obtusa TaxID=76774 RepID=A0AAF0ITM3_9BASI|nr:Protein cwh43 [Malassezia obtusa]